MRVYMITVEPGMFVTVPEKNNTFTYNPFKNLWTSVSELTSHFNGDKLPYAVWVSSSDIWVDLFNEIIVDNIYRTIIRYETWDELQGFIFVSEGPYIVGTEEIEI